MFKKIKCIYLLGFAVSQIAIFIHNRQNLYFEIGLSRFEVRIQSLSPHTKKALIRELFYLYLNFLVSVSAGFV